MRTVCNRVMNVAVKGISIRGFGRLLAYCMYLADTVSLLHEFVKRVKVLSG